jgi:threonine dehydratase
MGNRIYFKREDMQSVFSFKLRGAYNKMAHLTPAQLKRGVICASAGNHAQGVALSAKTLGCRAVIVMPTTTPQVKIDAVRARGGEVVLAGDSYSDAYQPVPLRWNELRLTFFEASTPPHAGQLIAVSLRRTSTSNSFAQRSHRYSYRGMGLPVKTEHLATAHR